MCESCLIRALSLQVPESYIGDDDALGFVELARADRTDNYPEEYDPGDVCLGWSNGPCMILRGDFNQLSDVECVVTLPRSIPEDKWDMLARRFQPLSQKAVYEDGVGDANVDEITLQTELALMVRDILEDYRFSLDQAGRAEEVRHIPFEKQIEPEQPPRHFKYSVRRLDLWGGGRVYEGAIPLREEDRLYFAADADKAWYDDVRLRRGWGEPPPTLEEMQEHARDLHESGELEIVTL